MTEEEAKTKWCPFVRADDKATNGRSINRWLGKEHLPVGTKCIASACMAWRWHYTPEQAADFNARFPDRKPATEAGFCGLAE